MKTTFLTIAVVLAGCLASAAPASAQLYIGGGYTAFQADAEDVNLGAVMGRVGYEVLPVLAIEGEAAIGVKDDNIDVLGTNFDVSIDNEIGGFVVGKLPVGGADLFARVGYANFSVDSGSANAPDGSGLAYGAGVNFNVLFLRLRAEYTRYEVDIDNYDSLGISALLKF